MKDWFVKNFILVSILFIAVLLRLSFLTAYPPGLTNDEVGEVYSAYSISQTGRDVFGHNYPLSVNLDNSFPPVLIYALAFIFKFSPFSPYAGRYVVALSGIFTVYILFRLVQKLTNNKMLALISSAVLAVSPWHIHLTRSSYGSVLSLFFFLTAGYTFFLMIEKRSYFKMIISFILFSLAFATYHATKVIFLPFLGLFIWYSWKESQVKFLSLWVSLLLTFAVIFSYKIFVKDQLPSAAGSIIVLNQQEIEKDIRAQRDQTHTFPMVERIFHNKASYLYDLFITQYLSAYSPEFFFTKGDGSGIYTIWGYGKQYSFEVLLFLLGLIIGVRVLKEKTYLFFFLWFLLGGLPAVLTTTPDSMRQILTIIPLMIFIALGLYWFIKQNQINLILSFLVYVFFIARFLVTYFFDYSINGAEYWFASMKDMTKFVNQQEDNYERIYISTQNTGDARRDIMTMLQYATFTHVEPKKLQELLMNQEKNQGNISFGNVYFLGRCLDDGKGAIYDILPLRTLYLLRPNICFKKDIPKTTLRSRDGKQDIWLLYTKKEI